MTILRAVCIAAAIGFGCVFVVTFLVRPRIEQYADAFLRSRIEEELGARFHLNTPVSRDRLDRVLADLPSPSREFVIVRPERFGRGPATIASIERENVEEGPRRVLHDSQLLEAGRRLRLQLLDDFLRELRWFTSTHGVLFAFTAMMTLRRRDGARYVLVPAALLAISTGIAAIAYLAYLTSLSTMMTTDYLGYVYPVIVALSAGLLLDIAWNRARIASVIARAFWFWPV